MELSLENMPIHMGFFPEFLQSNYPNICPYSYKVGSNLQLLSTSDFCAEVFKMTSLLREMGLKKGDFVISLMHSNPDWNILDISILRCGAVHIPFFYWDEDIEHALGQSNWRFFIRASDIVVKNDGIDYDARNEYIYDTLKLQSKKHEAEQSPSNEAEQLDRHDPAYVLYSLNNDGELTPYIISHHNLITVSWHAGAQLPLPSGLVYLSILPASKVFERASMLTHNLMGCTVHYPSSFGLPFNQVRESNAAVTSIVPALLAYPMRVPEGLIDKTQKTCLMNFWDFPVEKLKDFLGDRFRYFVCGGAEIPIEVMQRLEAAGVRVFEGYGLTQTTAGFCINNYQNIRRNSKGKVMPHMKVEIAADGEILVKGESLCMGASSSNGILRITDSDGWLHTGDMGFIDDEGFLFITRIKKSPFKLANGIYVNANRVEADLRSELQYPVMIAKRKEGTLHLFIMGDMKEEDIMLLKHYRTKDLLAMPVFSYSICKQLPDMRPYNYGGSDQDVIIGKKQRKL